MPPHSQAPAGAVDCHFHIYDPRFPYATGAVLKPGPATIADYRLLQRRLGTSRCVAVQPSSYGTDNRCLLEALRQFGPAVARGVAVVHPGVPDEELQKMNEAGVRGVRLNLLQTGATTLDMLAPLARRVAALGWHVQVNASPDLIAGSAGLFGDLPCPVVFDHFGHTIPAADKSPAFAVLVKLLRSGKAWLKLSGAYIDSRAGLPGYADSVPAARAYAAEALSQLVWGTDWPHPTTDSKPDDAALFDLLTAWVPDEAARSKILVDNPAKLYGFPQAKGKGEK